MNDGMPVFDVLGLVAGLIDIVALLLAAIVDPTVSIVGRVFAFISAILTGADLFGGGM